MLQKQLIGFVQRRSHEVLVDDLPIKTEHVLCIKLSPVQEKLYQEVWCRRVCMW